MFDIATAACAELNRVVVHGWRSVFEAYDIDRANAWLVAENIVRQERCRIAEERRAQLRLRARRTVRARRTHDVVAVERRIATRYVDADPPSTDIGNRSWHNGVSRKAAASTRVATYAIRGLAIPTRTPDNRRVCHGARRILEACHRYARCAISTTIHRTARNDRCTLSASRVYAIRDTQAHRPAMNVHAGQGWRTITACEIRASCAAHGIRNCASGDICIRYGEPSDIARDVQSGNVSG